MENVGWYILNYDQYVSHFGPFIVQGPELIVSCHGNSMASLNYTVSWITLFSLEERKEFGGSGIFY